ncbi:MAG: folate family ECF transporter S component [Lachnospiraceae bacterium]|nr:folate family ECF transporter S component [Lachnospiraceae bacterium]
MNQKNEPDRSLFDTPFSAKYWKLAALEMKSTRVLVLAGILTALRIAVKSLSIPIGPSLNITFGFIINALGSLIYGPIVAIFTSAISDTLGAMLFPTGTYFFPFIFEEIAGGVIFALFYYRAKITTLRVMLGRFAVTVLVNLMISPVIMIYYYKMILGKSYTFFTMPRMIKNLVMFPIQSLILVLLFGALLPHTNRMNLTYTGTTSLKFTKKDVLVLILLTVVSALAIVFYYWYKGLS